MEAVPGVDTSVAHIARIQNYLRGGTDNVPAVLAHARALLAGRPPGRVRYLDADLRDTGRLLEQAAAALDFSAPVAIMLVSVLHMVADGDGPHALVARLLDAAPAGSFLALTHVGADLEPEAT